MSGHRPFNELTKDWPQERKERNRRETERMLAEMELGQLREQAEVSQAELAERLETAQGAVSRLEKQQDMLLSTLRDYIRAIGGRLEIRAIFRDRAIALDHLGAGRGRKARRR